MKTQGSCIKIEDFVVVCILWFRRFLQFQCLHFLKFEILNVDSLVLAISSSLGTTSAESSFANMLWELGNVIRRGVFFLYISLRAVFFCSFYSNILYVGWWSHCIFPLHFIKGIFLLFLFCRIIFAPLWLFHVVVARGRFSLPAPSLPHDRHVWDSVSNFFFGYHFNWGAIYRKVNTSFYGQWAPCHSIMATPLLVAFEMLLCIHLESIYGMEVLSWNSHIQILYGPKNWFVQILSSICNFPWMNKKSQVLWGQPIVLVQCLINACKFPVMNKNRLNWPWHICLSVQCWLRSMLVHILNVQMNLNRL